MHGYRCANAFSRDEAQVPRLMLRAAWGRQRRQNTFTLFYLNYPHSPKIVFGTSMATL